MTAGTLDFNEQLTARAPLVFVFVLGLAFVLLLVAFRSIVIPLKAIVLNLLCGRRRLRGAGLRLPVRPLGELLGFQSSGAITSWLPLFLFVCCSGCRWTTTCSSSAGSARASTAG